MKSLLVIPPPPGSMAPCRVGARDFYFRVSKNSRWFGWPRNHHHSDKVAGSARLPQVPQVDAGRPELQEFLPPAAPSTVLHGDCVWQQELIRRWDSERELLRSAPRKLPEFAEITQNNAITPFKVIQGHRFWYHSKAHIRFPISD